MEEHEHHEVEHNAHKQGLKIKKNDLWKSASTILAILLIISIFFNIKGSSCTGGVVLSPDEVAEKSIDYINANLLEGGATAELVSISEKNNLYNMKLDIAGRPYDSYATKDGTLLFPSSVDMSKEAETVQQETIKKNKPENEEIKTFSDSGEEICYKDGKPIIRMYASSGCGFCKWNKPMFEKVVKEYMDEDKIVAYLWEDGKNIVSEERESITTEEEALRQKYGFSGVPAFLFGCKYYRGGATYSRAENGEALEEAELRTVIEDLLAS